MEKKITNRQTRMLLTKVQYLQRRSTIKMDVGTYFNEDGAMWFTVDAKLGDEYAYGSCYEWRTYVENKEELQRFIEEIQEYEKQKDQVCQQH